MFENIELKVFTSTIFVSPYFLVEKLPIIYEFNRKVAAKYISKHNKNGGKFESRKEIAPISFHSKFKSGNWHQP